MRYRPHIDGLRAIAVVPVVLFHLWPGVVPGGFVGVDVFFVISGYLIASGLLREMDEQTYALLAFYKRRVLRIFPALIVMLLAVAGASVALHLPQERVATGASIAAAAGFVSNVWFWMEAGYFSSPAESQPLLHTWSLAVEEQFYLIFPPVLFLIVRRARDHVLAAIMGLSGLSFLACILMTGWQPISAFYLIPFRAWELGAGAALAAMALDRGLPWADRAWPAVLGLFLIVLPMAVLDESAAFPGWLALLPVLGALLVTGWGASGPVGRALTAGPAVLVGRISYSLYLWHWPVIVFGRLLIGPARSPLAEIGLFGLSLLLAGLSTVLVERPFRGARLRQAPAGAVVAAGAVIMAGLAAAGFLLTRLPPSLQRFPEEVVAIAEVADYADTVDWVRQSRQGQCFIGQDEGGFTAYDKALCTGQSDGRPHVLLIGDSHAAQYWRSLQRASPGVAVLQANASGCRPLIGAEGEARCLAMRDWLFDSFLPRADVQAVVLTGRWRSEDMAGVAKTVAYLQGLTGRVIVVGPVPEYDGSLPQILARAQLGGQGPEVFLRRGPFEVNAALRAVVEGQGAYFADVLALLCPDQTRCQVWASDGMPLQFDYGHLTPGGAEDVVRGLDLGLEAITAR